MNKTFFIVVLFFFTGQLTGQQLPVYSQYFLNPYLYNPSFVGSDGDWAAFLSYRQQWVGIEDAPTTANFSLHKPLKLGLSGGLNIINDKRGIISTTSGLISLGYVISPVRDHFLRFGMSVGLGSNSIDFVNEPSLQNDPALINALDNNLAFLGNFGVSYSFETFNVGISLPQLFNPGLISDESFNVDFKPTDALIFMANYKYYFSQDQFAFQPSILYRAEKDQTNQLDLLGLIYYSDLAWAGASYRLDFGVTALVGFNIAELVSVGYAYEFSNSQVSGFGNGTHDIQLKALFGANKKDTRKGKGVVKKDRPEKPSKTAKSAKSGKSKKKGELSLSQKMAERRRRIQARRDSLARVQQTATVTESVETPTIARDSQPITVQEPVVETPLAEEPSVQPAQIQVSTPTEIQEPVPTEITDALSTRPPPVVSNFPHVKWATEIPTRPGPGKQILMDHQDEPLKIRKGNHPFDLKHGFYVIAAVFEDFEHCREYSDGIFEKDEYETRYGYGSDTKHWYVYTHHQEHAEDSMGNALRELADAKKEPLFHDPWILIVE